MRWTNVVVMFCSGGLCYTGYYYTTVVTTVVVVKGTVYWGCSSIMLIGSCYSAIVIGCF